MTTMNDVARLAQVSIATVSHVINKTRKVNTKTVEKVERAIRELNYQPNEQARSLKTGQSRLIGVMNYYSVDAFFSEVLSNLESSAYAAGYNVLLRHTEREGMDQGAAISAWRNKNIDGLVINSPFVTDDLYEQTENLGCPCVFLHINDPACKGDIIRGNDLEISEQAMRYLIQLGHKQIACIAGCAFEYQTASQRRIGYEKALQDAGILIRKDYFQCTDYSLQESYNKFKTLMELPDPPTAVFTYSDLLAMGAIRAAADMGLSIPGDISIIGYDDIDQASYCVPRLTTIYQDKKQIGELAFHQILKHLQNPALPPEDIVLPNQLIIRESTGPAKSS
ncbi:MAG: LacI family DNA-binding transcriptional regulator [Anaerolineaceae bacterium]|nr:LacI family DNA-binding transcriptional regulator [Anaerolineaceae bacterium]